MTWAKYMQFLNIRLNLQKQELSFLFSSRVFLFQFITDEDKEVIKVSIHSFDCNLAIFSLKIHEMAITIEIVIQCPS